ncbi:MAG: hypothetical protein HY909_30345 [Deltaproteobacteria bacterium]|nr:hypothetical protein [Deltaproteobacteria bacterium]
MDQPRTPFPWTLSPLRPVALAAALLGASCAAEQSFPVDLFPDTGVADSAKTDTADLDAMDAGDTPPPPDTLPPLDSTRDTTPPDTAVQDTTPTDSALPDTTTTDSVVTDGAGGDGTAADARPDGGPRSCRTHADCAGSGRTYCEPLTLRCVECLSIPDTCGAGTYCDEEGFAFVCRMGCRTDADCTGADGGAMLCDTATRRCTGCRTDAMCPAGQVCRAGGCTPGCGPTRPCPSGQLCCSGSCADTQTDVMRCGSCTTVCGGAGATPACVAGRCTIACAMGFGDCNRISSDGCETNLATNMTNCGMCGRACSLANARAACVEGLCLVAACTMPFQDCDRDAANGCEADTTRDARHCGACGAACGATQDCYSGMCIPRVTRYTFAGSSAAFVDACALPGHTQFLRSTSFSLTSDPVPIPFPFRFFGVPVTTLVASVSGFVVFEGSPRTSPWNPAMYPTTSAPRPAAFLYARQLQTRTNGVCVATVGTAPNRRLIVQWSDAQHYLDSSTHLTMELVLNEGANTLDYVYDTLTPASSTSGSSASVGMQNEDGTRGTTYSYLMASRLASGVALRFTPMP